MNTIQMTYLDAKKQLDRAQRFMDQAEQKFIEAHDIRDLGGLYLDSLTDIDDEELFNNSISAFYDKNADLSIMLQKARELLHTAENNLIDFCLSFSPTSISDEIRANLKFLKVRQRVIDLGMIIDERIAPITKEFAVS